MNLFKTIPCIAVLLIGVVGCYSDKKEKTVEKSEQALISLRWWPKVLNTPGMVEQTLAQIRQYPDAVDNIWLGTLSGLPSLEEHRQCAAISAEAAARIRADGMTVSLQISETIGHWGTGKKDAPWRQMVGADGISVPGISCPADVKFLDYEQEMIRIYVEAIRPDVVWIDDDLRMGNHGKIRYGCFCVECLQRFSARSGQHWTREALVAELTKEVKSSVRMEWIRFNQQTLADMAAAITRAVHSVAPDCRVGIQNCVLNYQYNGMDFNVIYQAVYDNSTHKAAVRPGAGFYCEDLPRAMIDKCFTISLTAQSARDSGVVEEVCAEIENYPHAAMGKTAYASALEGALDLAYGCNAVSFVINIHQTETAEWELGVMQELSRWRPIYEALRRMGRDSRPAGLNLFRGAEQAAFPVNPMLKDQEWDWVFFSPVEAEELIFSGIPICFDDRMTKEGKPALITRESARGMTETEWQRIVRSGALISGGAFALLQERGMTKDLGITIHPVGENVITSLVDFNNAQYSLPNIYAQAHYFELDDDAVYTVVMNASTFAGKAIGPSGILLETPEGGRLAILGQSTFSGKLSSFMQQTLFKMADWASRGKLPVIAETMHPAALIPLQRDEDGRLVGITVMNCSISPMKSLTLRLRHDRSASQQVRWLRPGEEPLILPLTALNEKESRLVLPALPGWSMGVVELF